MEKYTAEKTLISMGVTSWNAYELVIFWLTSPYILGWTLKEIVRK